MNQSTAQQTPSPIQHALCPICQGNSNYDLSSTDLMFGGTATYDYYKCGICHAVFINPMPDLDTIASFYPDNYSIYDPVIKKSRESRLKNAVLTRYYGYNGNTPRMVERLTASIAHKFKFKGTIPYTQQNRMLDIGCGNGRFLVEMNRLGWNGEGVEFNETAVTICRNHGLNVFQGDLHSAGYDDNSFDLITARHLIEHVPDPVGFIKEVVRILKPGGTLNIRTPNRSSLGRTLFGKYWFGNEIPRHLFLFNIAALDYLASREGLVRKEYRINTSPKLFLNSIDYLLKLKSESSKKMKLRRMLAKPFVRLAQLLRRGDEIHVLYVKPAQ